MSAHDYLTTAEAATKLSIGTDQVVSLIHCGALRAVDVSTGGKKPRWRIAQDDLDAFLTARTFKPMPAQPRRRRKPKGTVDYFAGL